MKANTECRSWNKKNHLKTRVTVIEYRPFWFRYAPTQSRFAPKKVDSPRPKVVRLKPSSLWVGAKGFGDKPIAGLGAKRPVTVAIVACNWPVFNGGNHQTGRKRPSFKENGCRQGLVFFGYSQRHRHIRVSYTIFKNFEKISLSNHDLGRITIKCLQTWYDDQFCSHSFLRLAVAVAEAVVQRKVLSYTWEKQTQKRTSWNASW